MQKKPTGSSLHSSYLQENCSSLQKLNLHAPDLLELGEKNNEGRRLDFIQLEQVLVFTHNLEISNTKYINNENVLRCSLNRHLRLEVQQLCWLVQ